MSVNKNITTYKGCHIIQIYKTDISNYLDIIKKTIPDAYIKCKEERDGGVDKYHLSIITSGEAKNLNLNNINQLEKITQMAETFNIKILGLGFNSNCYYLVCVSPQLDELRYNLGLEEKDFHITLGFEHTDQHNISKSIDTIVSINNPENFIETVIENLGTNIDKNIRLLTYLEHRYPDNLNVIKNLTNEYSKKSNYQKAQIYSKLMCDMYPDNMIGYYSTIKLMEKTDSYDLDVLKSFLSQLVKINNIKQKKIAFEVVKMLNELSIKYNFISVLHNEIEKSTTFILLAYSEEQEKILQINFISNSTHTEISDKLNLLSITTGILSSGLNIDHTNYIETLVMELNNQIIKSHSNPHKHIYIYTKKKEKEKDNQNLTNYVLNDLPVNFSLVLPNLYGSGIVSVRHISPLSSLGITTIINLIGEEKPNDKVILEYEKYNIKLIDCGFKDRTACDFDTYLKIQEIIRTNIIETNKCLVHCKGGIGRTNMILAGRLMDLNNLSPAEAIGMLKKTRKVIMVPEQIMGLKKYYGYLANLNSTNTENNNQSITLPKNLKGLIIIMGLPCSGKSTLALEIYSKYSTNPATNIVHLNQDEIGKDACEKLLSSQAKIADLIIIDRCNPTSSDRTHWVNLYRGTTDKKITIVFLNFGLELSLKRIETRTNHLTLGSTGGNIIKVMDKKMTIPAKQEGWDELIQINTMEQLEEFKNKIGLGKEQPAEQVDIGSAHPPPPSPLDISKIIKFPRTKHIVNLGAMARDDLLMDKKDIDTMLSSEIIVEEKIDGANLGFRLDPSTNKIVAQNRSHYVCSSSHPQFKKLDGWIESNKSGLMKILSGGNNIIYGEWLFSKHSINYTNLPDYFIMFDLYDIGSNTFYSRDWVEKKIEETGINLVPLIFKGKTTIDKLKTLAQSKSQFYDGVVEGVYVRSCDKKTNKLKLRAKIVRADFISGDEHWTKGKQTLNIVSKYKN